MPRFILFNVEITLILVLMVLPFGSQSLAALHTTSFCLVKKCFNFFFQFLFNQYKKNIYNANKMSETGSGTL